MGKPALNLQGSSIPFKEKVDTSIKARNTHETVARWSPRRYPDDADALLGRGRVYAWEKRFDEATKDLRILTEKFPNYADAWSALGDLYLWSGRADLALSAYTKWAELALVEGISSFNLYFFPPNPYLYTFIFPFMRYSRFRVRLWPSHFIT